MNGQPDLFRLPGPPHLPKPLRHMRGFSLLELLTASFLALLVLTGILYIYKGQQKNMLVNSSVSELRMNGQYALNEAQYYLLHAGLGLPTGFRNLAFTGEDLVVLMNPSKQGFSATKHFSGSSTRTVFQLDRADAGAAFASSAYALVGGRPSEQAIAALTQSAGSWYVEFADDQANYPAKVTLYPLDRVILRREADGGFRTVVDNPNHLAGLANLKLAEGIDTLAYTFISVNGARQGTLPASLDTLKRIEIRVVARTLYLDGKYPGDGYRRKTFTSSIGYRRTF